MLAALLAAALTLAQAGTPTDFVKRQNEFALELLRVAAREPGNALLSPYSVALALSMAREGARGDTATELDRVLRLPDGGAGDQFAELALKLAAPSIGAGSADLAYEFECANSIWAQDGYPLEPAFIERLDRGFAARIFNVDFGHEPEAACDAINAWVATATRDHIKGLIEANGSTSSLRLVLANAVYLKMRWRVPFALDATRNKVFHAPTGDVQVPTMSVDSRYLYGESTLARVLRLPCDGGLEMDIVLPRKQDGLSEVLARESVAEWIAKCDSTETHVALPRFTFDKSFDLVPALRALGLNLACEAQRADFGGISVRAANPAQPLYIGVVRHKASIVVDEQGAVAAAATAVGLAPGASMQSRTQHFVVDHPFLFVIRHSKTGLVLFAGRVDDPTAN